ncbi:MAG: choice-of-anchor D domain-containing protein [Planctomycetes bacterium]|nr:choice-of-anchor D domain-containing protein [Planctomycetota bacterium]
MKRALLLLLIASSIAPVLFSQTVTKAWGEQLMYQAGGSSPATYNPGPDKMFGHEFTVAQNGVVPEIVQLGCALPIPDFSTLPAGYQVTVDPVKVVLWEVTTSSSGTRLAVADVVPVAGGWGWTTLPQPIALTPGKAYRVAVITGVNMTVTDPSNQMFPVTNNEIYFYHHSSNTPLTQPSAPIQFVGGVEAQVNYTTGATINDFPGGSGGYATNPWGMADIAWRETQVAPTLDVPATGISTPSVFITEAGPDVIPAGHEGGEIQNLGTDWEDISGWRVCIWDSIQATLQAQSKYEPVAIGTFPQGTAIAPGQVISFGEAVGGSAFELAFGNWGWGATSESAVALLDANDNIIDLLSVNNLSLSSISNPVSGFDSFWSGTQLGQWNISNSWQRQGSADNDTAGDWTSGNSHSLGTQNTVLSAPFNAAGETYAAVGGTAPAFTGQLGVGDNLDVTFKGDDLNTNDNLVLSVNWNSGLTPAQAGFTSLSSNQPLTTSGTGSLTLTLTGTAQMAGTITLDVSITDSTNQTAGYTYTLTIDPIPNYSPVFTVTYNTGSGAQKIISGASFGTTATPVPFGIALSTYSFQLTVSDGNNDSVGVAANLQLAPTSAQQGITGTEFEHSAQTAPYSWSPNGSALFAHMNNVDTTFTLTLTADDGNGGTRQFVITFLVEARPTNALPSVTVNAGGSNVGNGNNVVVASGSTLASLGLQIDVDDADQDPVQLTATISNITTQGIVTTEFESTGFANVAYSLTPNSGTFSIPTIIHQVDLTADDGNWLGTKAFTFYIVVNRTPTMQVTSNGNAVTSGSTLNVNYLDTLASLGLSISVDDPDGDPTAVGASVSGVTTQGFSTADFSAAQQPVGYVITPNNGTFNDPAGSSHAITLTATDQYGFQVSINFTIVAGLFAPQLEVSENGGLAIANGAAATGGRQFGTQDINSGPTAALTIVIANTGSGPLDVAGVALTGANSSDFVLTASGLPTQVFPGTPFTFSLAFDPVVGGLKQAGIEIQYTAAGTQGTFSFALEGTGHDPSGLAITTTKIPTGVLDVTYGPVQLLATGGAGGETWSIFSGSLPTGLTLSPQGVLSGKAIGQAGTSTFIVRVTDSQGGTDEQTLSLQLLDKPSGNGSTGASCEVGSGSRMGLLAILALFGLGFIRRRRATQ